MTTKAKIVLGIGTGRCGTVSLALLLDGQPNSRVTHESRPLLRWYRRQMNSYNVHRDRFISRSQKCDLVGDIAFFWLPCLPSAIRDFPDLKIIVLQRDRAATIKSFMEKTVGVNHWMNHDGTQWKKTVWDGAFPKYEARDKAEAIGKYWDDYYATAGDWLKKCPGNFLLIKLEDLSTEKRQDELFGFLGIENHRHILPCKFNVGDDLYDADPVRENRLGNHTPIRI